PVQAVEGAAFLLGRPASARLPGGRGGWRRFLGRREIFVECPRLRRRPTPDATAENPIDQNATIERDGQDVAGLYRMGGLLDLPAIDADVAGDDELCRKRARFGHTGEE